VGICLALAAAAVQAARTPPLLGVPAALASAPAASAPPPVASAVAPAGSGAAPGSAAAPAGSAQGAASAATPPASSPVALSEGHPGETSARPTLAEWKTAPLLVPTRRSARSAACRIYRVREWLKIHCDGLTASFAQLAGNTDDVSLWVAQKAENEMFTFDDTHGAGLGAEAIFPLRRGDRRVLQRFDVWGGEYGGFGIQGGVVIDARWLEVEHGPRLVLR
jgi:hypothetical protein